MNGRPPPPPPPPLMQHPTKVYSCMLKSEFERSKLRQGNLEYLRPLCESWIPVHMTLDNCLQDFIDHSDKILSETVVLEVDLVAVVGMNLGVCSHLPRHWLVHLDSDSRPTQKPYLLPCLCFWLIESASTEFCKRLMGDSDMEPKVHSGLIQSQV